MKIQIQKITCRQVACLLVAAFVTLPGIAKAAVIITDDFESGLSSNWNLTNGTWTIVSVNGTHVVQNTSAAAGGYIGQAFTPITAPAGTGFTLSYNYGYEFGNANNSVGAAVAVEDASGNGYRFNIRQGPTTGFKYELAILTGGVITNLKVGGTSPSETGGAALASAQLTWDGITLTGYQNGIAVISVNPTTRYNTFSALFLQEGNSSPAGARFDNITLDMVPEPGMPSLLVFGFLTLFFLLRRKPVLKNLS